MAKQQLIMDYHHATLLAHEQREARDDIVAPCEKYFSFYVITSLWEEWADTPDELKDLLFSAKAGGLEATIEIHPF